MKEMVSIALAAGSQGLVLARDAIGDIVGGSLPFDEERFLEPGHFNEMLNQYAVDDAVLPVSVSGVSKLPIKSLSSNCNNVIVQIQQEGEARLPDTLFVKLPSPDLATRWFLNLLGTWALESYFCQHIAPQIPFRTPVTYATASKGSRFFLVQENLHADPTVQLFTNMDMLKGPPLDLVRRCLDTFAQLHACHYDLDAAARERILPMENHIFLGKKTGAISLAMNTLGLPACLRQYPDLLPKEVVASYKKTVDNWDKLLDVWFTGNLSLLHGDSHLGNFFVSGEQMGMLDFQAVHWGKGARDVQYFLIDSLPSDVLAEHEQSLVAYYVERRAVHGTPIDFETTWQEYRGFTYHTLMTIVVSTGFGALNGEQAEVFQEILRRAVAAVERVDYAGWLDAHC